VFAVINHLHLSIPVDQIIEPLRGEGLAVLQAQPGFRGFQLIREADDRATAIILWEDGAAAQAGAAVFGPTWFAANIAPHLASEQQRTVGPVVVSG
jgi:hypothetical protein